MCVKKVPIVSLLLHYSEPFNNVGNLIFPCLYLCFFWDFLSSYLREQSWSQPFVMLAHFKTPTSASACSPSVCRGTNCCLLGHKSTKTALTLTLPRPSTCMLALKVQRKTGNTKQSVFCLHLSPGICDHQADRGGCCSCNGPIVLCLGFYLHYTFYNKAETHFFRRQKERVCFCLWWLLYSI